MSRLSTTPASTTIQELSLNPISLLVTIVLLSSNKRPKISMGASKNQVAHDSAPRPNATSSMDVDKHTNSLANYHMTLVQPSRNLTTTPELS